MRWIFNSCSLVLLSSHILPLIFLPLVSLDSFYQVTHFNSAVSMLKMLKMVLSWHWQLWNETDFPPAHLNRVAEVQRIHGFFAFLEVADIKVGQRMVDKSMHGAIGTVHVLVDHSRDEVWSEGDDKCLGIVVGKMVVVVGDSEIRSRNVS